MPKTCSRCGLEKPLRDFYKQAGGAQGRRGMCKECFRAAERASYASEDSRSKRQMPPQCGQCGGGMELLEEGDDYLLAQCTLCRRNTLIHRGELSTFISRMSHPGMDAEFISRTADA